ncbi:hypothetical protein IV54_GL001580 [Levilactobacillus paucivorans]|uniref:Uncharacterized protein n=1 Tax=Levilactobacillus paucivorans TaxID=616990 RepID=A0A0R2LWV7_9LACO|nr:hypothetical protein [Levilactobacillus paucivorans]KRO04064.1 hypothetical protein IV54_GL001580 [Levilactobacillus paucivorans]
MGLLSEAFKKLEKLLKKVWDDQDFKNAMSDFVLAAFRTVVHEMISGEGNSKSESQGGTQNF